MEEILNYTINIENDIDSACSLSLPGAQDLESMLIYLKTKKEKKKEKEKERKINEL